jgi:hypothetical protein
MMRSRHGKMDRIKQNQFLAQGLDRFRLTLYPGKLPCAAAIRWGQSPRPPASVTMDKGCLISALAYRARL